MSNDVAKVSDAVEDMQDDWEKLDHLLEGTDGMREAGKKYLPQWPAEDDESYRFRLKTSTLTNFIGHTADILSSKPFAKPVTISQDMPDQLTEWLGNIDTEGRNLHVFAQEIFETALAYGMTHILIDYPRVAPAKTIAEERALGARPYWIHVKSTQLLGWKTTKVGDRLVLSQLRYEECIHEDDGEFLTKEQKQIRVLEPGKWAVYRPDADDNWSIYDHGVTSLDFIPLVTIYTGRCGFMRAKSPLMDIADLNIKHWQSQSDQDAILHVARVPLLALIGVGEDDELVVGAKAAMKLPSGADAKYVEHSGKAIEAGRQSLQDLEEQMRVLGAELLVKKQVSTTATQAGIDNSNENSALQQMAGALEDTINLAIQYTAKWARIDNPAEVTIYKDFTATFGGLQSETVLLNMATASKLSDETLFREYQRRGLIDDKLDWAMEQERISQDGPALGMMGNAGGQ